MKDMVLSTEMFCQDVKDDNIYVENATFSSSKKLPIYFYFCQMASFSIVDGFE